VHDVVCKDCSLFQKKGITMIYPAQKILRLLILTVLLGMPLMLTTGCGALGPLPKPEVRVSTKQQSTLMAKADQAMLEGRYDDARRAYEKLLTTNGKGVPASLARYGLACIALITAETRNEYEQSLTMFRTWAANDPAAFYNGDPRHLLPVLTEHRRTLDRLERARTRMSACQNEFSQLQTRANGLEKKNEQLKQKVEALQTQKQNLQRKMDELEELYKQLQDARENL
jgi:tetratricopeptide (TPR) repeat protein